MGCEHNTMCVCLCVCNYVHLGASVIDHFHSNLSHLSSLSGQRVKHSEGNTVNIAHTTLMCHNLAGVDIKVHCWNQNVSRIPYKNHWTPHSCDEEKQGRLQSQHNFPPFSRKKAQSALAGFCPFAAHSLRSAVKETSSGITAHRSFFFSSGNSDLMSSKCPPSEVLM